MVSAGFADLEEEGKKLYRDNPFYKDLAFTLFHPNLEEIYERYSDKDTNAKVFQRAFELGRQLSGKCDNNFIVLSLIHQAITNSTMRQQLFHEEGSKLLLPDETDNE